MRIRCTRCGYAADDANFFRRERGGVFRLKKTVCDACTPYQPTRYESRGTWGLLAWQPIWLLVLLARAGDNPVEAMGFASFLISGLLGLPLAIAVHEAGHAVAARLVGRCVVDVRIGRGPIVARWRIGSAEIVVGKYVFVGGLTRIFASDGRRSRWRDGVLLLGGVCANVLVAGPAFFAATALTYPDDALGTVGSMAWLALALVNAGMAAWNVLPWQIGGIGPSDGARLMALAKPDTLMAADARRLWRTAYLSEMGRFAAVEAEATPAALAPGADPLIVVQALNAISKLRGDGAAMDWYLASGLDPDAMSYGAQATTAMRRAWLKGSLAWHALMTDRPDLRPLAETFARQAHEALPQVSAMKGNYGLVLDRQGDCDEGLQMILDGARGASSDEEKADFCEGVAAGLRRRGVEARANGFAAVAALSRAKMAAQYR